MAGCQAETFQWAPPVHISKLVSCCLVAKKTAITSFSIFCVKCLWDSVRHFLGLWFLLNKPLMAGRHGLVIAVHQKSCRDRFK